MMLLDRYILVRFAVNFASLFSLLFIFGIAIDLMINLDDFVDRARVLAGPDGGLPRFAWHLLVLAGDFQAPRLFQFYAYLHGLVAVGAMGFTLAQMNRYRELVAMMASGLSLHRVAMPFIVATFVLSLVQLANQELLLPRVAPLLLRTNKDIGHKGVEKFEIGFTPDGAGNLLHAPSFDPQLRTLEFPTFIERDQQGRTIRRITAERATWSADDRVWLLVGGRSLKPATLVEDGQTSTPHVEALDRYKTELTPEVLMVRRYGQFAAMLSMGQISQMLESPLITDRDSLLRHYYSRFASVLTTLLIMALSLPCFLLREPASLLKQSLLCASIAIPATVGSAMAMLIEMPGVSPAVGVFMPVIMLGFMTTFPWSFLRT